MRRFPRAPAGRWASLLVTLTVPVLGHKKATRCQETEGNSAKAPAAKSQVRGTFGPKQQLTEYPSSKLLIRMSGVRIPPGALHRSRSEHLYGSDDVVYASSVAPRKNPTARTMIKIGLAL